jgi:hypothetical protein
MNYGKQLTTYLDSREVFPMYGLKVLKEAEKIDRSLRAWTSSANLELLRHDSNFPTFFYFKTLFLAYLSHAFHSSPRPSSLQSYQHRISSPFYHSPL